MELVRLGILAADDRDRCRCNRCRGLSAENRDSWRDDPIAVREHCTEQAKQNCLATATFGD